MRRLLKKYASELGISDIQSEMCYYITFKASDMRGKELTARLEEILLRDGLDTAELISDGEFPIYDKYDEYIPAELLRDAYAIDRLRADEIIERFGGKL